MRNLTRALTLELAPQQINVNNLAPGMVLTPFNQPAVTTHAALGAGAVHSLEAGGPAVGDRPARGVPCVQRRRLRHRRDVRHGRRFDAQPRPGSLSMARDGLITSVACEVYEIPPPTVRRPTARSPGRPPRWFWSPSARVGQRASDGPRPAQAARPSSRTSSRCAARRGPDGSPGCGVAWSGPAATSDAPASVLCPLWRWTSRCGTLRRACSASPSPPWWAAAATRCPSTAAAASPPTTTPPPAHS